MSLAVISPIRVPVAIDERKLLDLALDHQPLGRFDASARPRRRRARSTGVIRVATVPLIVRHESHVALGQQPLQPAAVVDDDERAHAALPHQRDGFGEGRRRRDGIRVADDRRAACA